MLSITFGNEIFPRGFEPKYLSCRFSQLFVSKVIVVGYRIKIFDYSSNFLRFVIFIANFTGFSTVYLVNGVCVLISLFSRAFLSYHNPFCPALCGVCDKTGCRCFVCLARYTVLLGNTILLASLPITTNLRKYSRSSYILYTILAFTLFQRTHDCPIREQISNPSCTLPGQFCSASDP